MQTVISQLRYRQAYEDSISQFIMLAYYERYLVFWKQWPGFQDGYWVIDCAFKFHFIAV